MAKREENVVDGRKKRPKEEEEGSSDAFAAVA